MGCGCNKSSSAAGYKVKFPDGTFRYATDVGSARIMRQAHETPYAVIIMQVSREEAQAAIDAAKLS